MLPILFYTEDGDRIYLRNVGNIAHRNKVVTTQEKNNIKTSDKKWFPGSRFEFAHI
jgi:hypothetical protein